MRKLQQVRSFFDEFCGKVLELLREQSFHLETNEMICNLVEIIQRLIR